VATAGDWFLFLVSFVNPTWFPVVVEEHCRNVGLSYLPKLLILCSLLVFVQLGSRVRAQLEESSLKVMTDTFEWPKTILSLYDNMDGG